MKKRSILTIGIIVLIMSLAFAGCQTGPSTEVAEPTTINVATLAGPTGMGMSYLMTGDVELVDNLTAEYTVATSPDQVLPKIISGEYDIAAVPTNAASVLYNKTESGVQLAAVNTLGVLYILTGEGTTVESIADLEGQTLYASGQGSTVEYVLDYILEENGLTPGEDVTIEWVADHSELAAQVTSGAVTLAVLPQPFVTTVTMNNENVSIALDITEEWEAVADGTTLPMGCIVVNKEFAEENPEAVNAFLAAYEESVNMVNDDPDAAGEAIAEAGIIASAEMAAAAVPDCNIVYMSATDAQNDVESFYDILMGMDPTSIGGAKPDEGFYYQPE
jgi:NitT/TauT family transport system substrate-binding protein